MELVTTHELRKDEVTKIDDVSKDFGLNSHLSIHPFVHRSWVA